jgi:putative choline sulfate-utilization transcription factor
MAKIRLPPLPTLASFEAAARHASFTAAAGELGTTQSAVSHQIAALERALGAALFRRQHRGVALTEDGRRLHDAVGPAFAAIAEAAAAITRTERPATLTVATDFAFATFWLLPRLQPLRRALGGIDVRVLATQEEPDPHDRTIDAVIVFGRGHWPGCAVDRLFTESVVPVVSPALATAPLPDLPLLHLEPVPGDRWMDWSAYLAARGIDAPARRGLTLGNYPLVLQAAAAGQGVALGWRPLVDEMIAAGQLATLPGPPVTTRRGYFLVRPAADRPDPVRRALRDWLVRSAAER